MSYIFLYIQTFDCRDSQFLIKFRFIYVDIYSYVRTDARCEKF